MDYKYYIHKSFDLGMNIQLIIGDDWYYLDPSRKKIKHWYAYSTRESFERESIKHYRPISPKLLKLKGIPLYGI